ncbi:hypothetical protein RKD34_002623 [Streptomyces sp. SAI-218]
MTGPRDGRVITFYSYKGGTGRTMALANTAWILAANGKRVLAVDWDLEAPGLHRFFHPFLDPKALSATPGVITHHPGLRLGRDHRNPAPRRLAPVLRPGRAARGVHPPRTLRPALPRGRLA